MDSEKKLICTLGPSSMDPNIIKKFDKYAHVGLFRINLSHTPLDEIEKNIKLIKSTTSKPLCIDTEGAQMRCGRISNSPLSYYAGDRIVIHNKEILGDKSNIYFTPRGIARRLKVGDLVSIDFNSLLLKVIKTFSTGAEAIVICDGHVSNNKAVTVNRSIKLPCLSVKDKSAIAIGLKMGVEYAALSFAGSKSDVQELRGIVGDKMHIISKIESNNGLLNLDEIIEATDSILIDRGDLSREQSLEKIPFLQKEIIKHVKKRNRQVYVATNLLESMVHRNEPTRAEVNDIINTLLDGADGLVLAAETAIGKYPVECAYMVNKVINSFHLSKKETCLNELIGRPKVSLFLTPPCGGELKNRVYLNEETDSLKGLKELFVNEEILIDLEQIAVGAFSPLEGFMTREEILSVLDNYRLPDGTIWTLPIVLQATKEKVSALKTGDRAALMSETDQRLYGSIDIESIYEFPFEDTAKKWYGTTDEDHPGVGKLKRDGGYFIGGKIKLYQHIHSPHRSYIYTPSETRIIFENRGWNTVVGFHTRNVAHRAHEYLQKTALSRYGIDGLFIHPVIGPKKKGDYMPKVILDTYSSLIKNNHVGPNVFLGAFYTYSRYAGPREAVFTALCRKNFGCTHFIVGRDHTGVGNYYGENDSKELFNSLGNIGIKPVFFDNIHYCHKSKAYVEAAGENRDDYSSLSATQARDYLLSGKLPPEYLMRENISHIILDEMKSGSRVFV